MASLQVTEFNITALTPGMLHGTQSPAIDSAISPAVDSVICALISCIIPRYRLWFLTDFYSAAAHDAWEADTEYNDYQWWLARTDGGDWEVVSRGYN